MDNPQPIAPLAQAPLPLSYEPPQPKPSNAAGAIVLVTLFICGTSAGIFAIEVDGHRYSSSGMPDNWPAAIAVLALALMGTSIAFFLTRRR